MDKYAQLFERDMAIRGLADGTRREYLKRLRNFAEFLGRSPAEATLEDVKNYQYHLMREKKVSWGHLNMSVSALKLFFGKGNPSPEILGGRELPLVDNPGHALRSDDEVLEGLGDPPPPNPTSCRSGMPFSEQCTRSARIASGLRRSAGKRFS